MLESLTPGPPLGESDLIVKPGSGASSADMAWMSQLLKWVRWEPFWGQFGNKLTFINLL